MPHTNAAAGTLRAEDAASGTVCDLVATAQGLREANPNREPLRATHNGSPLSIAAHFGLKTKTEGHLRAPTALNSLFFSLTPNNR